MKARAGNRCIQWLRAGSGPEPEINMVTTYPGSDENGASPLVPVLWA